MYACLPRCRCASSVEELYEFGEKAWVDAGRKRTCRGAEIVGYLASMYSFNGPKAHHESKVFACQKLKETL
jgi:hypothetical protein